MTTEIIVLALIASAYRTGAFPPHKVAVREARWRVLVELHKMTERRFLGEADSKATKETE